MRNTCSVFGLMGAILMFAACQQPDPPPPEPAFEAQTLDSNVAIGYGLAIGDVDDDGQNDIILADKKQFVWYRNGDWTRFVIAENLTERDNVCIAARDIDGDGMVEIAVGAMWNPGETTDENQSGSVHYLIRPDDPTTQWEAVQLHHEPTVHRMRWVRMADGSHQLVVAPLHGRGNQGGEGEGVKIQAYQMPDDPRDEWTIHTIDDQMHMTHNFAVVETENELAAMVYIAGREGIRLVMSTAQGWPDEGATEIPTMNRGAGEVRIGTLGDKSSFITTIEPMHGTDVAVYAGAERIVLDSTYAQGHALATGDVLGIGRDQVVAGWRNANAEDKVGIKLFTPMDESGQTWRTTVVDDNTMAAEDLKLADLDGDGRLDIIAAGRSTNNLIIYWNRTGDEPQS